MEKQFSSSFLIWKLTEEENNLGALRLLSAEFLGRATAPSCQQQGHRQTHIPPCTPRSDEDLLSHFPAICQLKTHLVPTGTWQGLSSPGSSHHTGNGRVIIPVERIGLSFFWKEP
ncbi:unnamed protein product [Rangifer tarandus platyrhynchus]|uniref:Uncharacterized protein n=1 Tax=Rangifer tarandus platyrhynchus TaxID=3082113 RepID=A0AC59YWL6_RANTA